jgi:NAD(P)-dependent dehydrogenase (short-subunit alcohol dehydrogenase family)
MGADAAGRFAEEGAKVVVADVTGDAAGAVPEQVGGLAVEVDVVERDSVRAM